jgi:hypothetical protein
MKLAKKSTHEVMITYVLSLSVTGAGGGANWSSEKTVGCTSVVSFVVATDERSVSTSSSVVLFIVLEVSFVLQTGVSNGELIYYHQSIS